MWVSPAITVHTLRKKGKIKQWQSSQYYLTSWYLDAPLIRKIIEVGKIFGVDCWDGCTPKKIYRKGVHICQLSRIERETHALLYHLTHLKWVSFLTQIHLSSIITWWCRHFADRFFYLLAINKCDLHVLNHSRL